MDDADLAEERMERDLELAVQAARGVQPQYALHCDDCGEPLAAHRQPYGRCVRCQAKREAAVRRGLVGV